MPSRLQLNYIAPVLLTAAVFCVYWVKSPRILTAPRAAAKVEAAKNVFVPSRAGDLSKPVSATTGQPQQGKGSQGLSVVSKPAGHIQRLSKDSSGVPAIPQRAGESPVALHVHFNGHQFWKDIFWFLNETELCHPRNFMFCAFVSSWSRLGSKPQLPSHSRFGVPVALVDCPENSLRWPSGRFMYRCFAHTLEMAAARGAAGMLAIADDVVLLKPWHSLMPLLLANETAVLPFPGERCDVRSQRWCDSWLPLERPALIRALESLPTADKALLNVTPGPVVVAKALGDVAYLPSNFAPRFRRAAEHLSRSSRGA